MKIAAAQINTTVGDFEGNASKIIKYIEMAQKDGADLIVFPEMCVSSYPPRDLLEKSYFILRNLDTIDRIAKRCISIGAIIGYVSVNESSTGKGLFNSAAVLKNGRIEFIQHKALLPTYDVFDEARHFEPGSSHKVYSFAETKLGITICEDVWSTLTFGGRKIYHYDPVDSLVKHGAEVIINISASPFHVGKGMIREALITQAAVRHKVPIIYINAVGGNDELIFDGRSIVVNKSGLIVKEGRTFGEDYFIVDTGKLEQQPVRQKINDIEELYNALVMGLSDYMKKCGFQKTVIGLSGGIDSSVVASLAVAAAGPENVFGIAMPSPYSSKESVTDAKALAENLGIDFKIISIDDIYKTYLTTLKPCDVGGDIGLTEENIQARIRGNILMAISNKTGALLLSTGNKSELAVGYCTLYGDMAGGLAVISDVPKTSVYDLARHINRRNEIIPNASITKPPSAELRPGQMDTDSLPPYDTLDKILRLYVEEHAGIRTIIDAGFDKNVVEDVVKRVDRNEYKRRQAPPGFKVTSKAFGAGRRHPIAWKY